VIYSSVRFGVTPQINALATLLLLVSFIAVILAQRASRLGDSLRRKGS
jgi:spermidine/putrescine transport system permease protein